MKQYKKNQIQVNNVNNKKNSSNNLLNSRKVFKRSIEHTFYDVVLKNSLEAFFILDYFGNYIEVNNSYCKQIGYSRKELLSMTIMDTDIGIPTVDNWIQRQKILMHRKNNVIKRLTSVKRKDGVIIYFQSHNKLIHSSAPEDNMVFCFGTNVTDLIRHREKLELLNRRCINAQEKERLRIARNLHDLLTQGLIVIRMEIISFLKQIKIHSHKIKLTEVLGLLDHALDDIQNISKQLRPQNLDAFGLIKSIQLYVDDFEKLSNMRCQVKIMNPSLIEMDINKEISITAYRILQEALLNILRHSMATNVIVTINFKDDILGISISDNGCGMNSDVYIKTSSLGILGMYERANLVGGNLTIKSKPGKGTKVIISIPLSKSADKEKTEDYGCYQGFTN